MFSAIAVRRCNGEWLVVALVGSAATAAVTIFWASVIGKFETFLGANASFQQGRKGSL
jgi:hypothetical protein